MGLRGPGAHRLVKARKGETKPIAETWNAPGLSRFERVLRFIEAMPCTKGILAGKPIKLLPDQIAFLKDVYDRPDERRTRLGIKSAPRGNGKTGLAAPLALCHLLGPEAENRGEVYSAAIDRQQAGIMFAEMEAIILAVPQFARRCNIQRFHKRIEVQAGDGIGSTYEALSADARRAHGLSPTLWVYDELAQAKDRELLDNLQTAMGKRNRALGLIISTQAPSDEHPLSQLIDDGITGADPSIVVHLLSAGEEEDPFDPKTIRSVNPALGIFLDESDLLSEAERARRIPAFESAFRNLRLNQRVDANIEERLCTASVWREGAVAVNRKKLKGRPCFAALDLSAKHDLTSLTLVFPDEQPEPAFDVLQFFWTPQGQLAARRPAEQEKFREWIRSGFITATPGPTVQFGFVARELIKLAKEFNIQVLGYDSWRIEDFKRDLADADPNFPVPLEPFVQGWKSFGPAIQWFTELSLHNRLRHGGNPVLSACVSSAVLVTDPAGNQKIDKDKSRGGPVRIDGAVTLVMALELAKRFVPKPKIEVLAMVA